MPACPKIVIELHQQIILLVIAVLGYPSFAHLRRKTRKGNPVTFVLAALSQSNLEARTAEGLPRLVLEYPDMPEEYLVREARARNLQNRLGFVVTLAEVAGAKPELQVVEQKLSDSKGRFFLQRVD